LANLIILGTALWLLAGLLALVGFPRPARSALVLGAAAFIVLAVVTLPGATPELSAPFGLPDARAHFHLAPASLWLFGFGLVPALLAAWLGTPAARGRQWTFGLAISLLGALGVFGLQDAISFIVAWEIMSLGGALMILGERLARDDDRSARVPRDDNRNARAPRDNGRGALFMLALLEVGTVALILALLLLSGAADSLDFAAFPKAAAAMPFGEKFAVGLLLLLGFGAKIGLLPFYEWFPTAYGAGSGATGAVFSGVILNAAYFGLGRGLLGWLPAPVGMPVSYLGIVIVVVGVASAILTVLYAFQQNAWRELLSFSSAENGAIAVTMLGVALMFRQDMLSDLAGLAFAVGLIHLAGHTLAKGALFLTADGVYRARGSYDLVQSGFLKQMPVPIGLGAFIAAMSLAAMPPMAGFVSEWYVFQTVFQGFHLASLASRLVAAIAGAGLALTVAIALATFIKAIGIGLLGDSRGQADAAADQPEFAADTRSRLAFAVGLCGLLVLALAVGMPLWLGALRQAVQTATGSSAAVMMRDGWDLVPLSIKFAFISPSKLVIAMPLLALLPLLLLLLSRKACRRVPVWYGGHVPLPGRAATTALAFSNALRTFYSFIYRPTEEIGREAAPESNGQPYFTRRLSFRHDVAPIFGPCLFAPLERFVRWLAGRIRRLQSGNLNAYLAAIGMVLLIILAVSLFA